MMTTAPRPTTYEHADRAAADDLLTAICRQAVRDLRTGPKYIYYGSARSFLREIGLLERVEQRIEEGTPWRLNQE